MARKKLDLTGHRFGRLVVIKELPRNGSSSPRWLCKCDCGNEKTSTTIVLRRGDCNSCGCLRKEHLDKIHNNARTIDLTNKRFGKLVALEKLNERKDSRIMWRCKCDCGNYTDNPASELIRGHVKSCGCINKELAKSWTDEGTNIARIKSGTISKRNKSGVTGVHFDKNRNKWTAEIMFKKKRYRLGRFDNKADAINARLLGEEKYHKSILDNKSVRICQGVDCNNKFIAKSSQRKYCSDQCRWRTSKRKTYEKREKEGLCYQCGGKLTEGSRSNHCEKCQKYFRDRYYDQKLDND